MIMLNKVLLLVETINTCISYTAYMPVNLAVYLKSSKIVTVLLF